MLDLTNGGSEAVPLAGLAKATSLPKLRELRVGGCMMGDDVMAELAKAKTLRFKCLVAVRNDFTDVACDAIANATWAPQLEVLHLSSNELIGNEGLRALAQSTTLGALKRLKLEYIGITEEAVDIVLGSPVFAKLEHLDLTMNLSREDRDRIRAVFGDRLRG